MDASEYWGVNGDGPMQKFTTITPAEAAIVSAARRYRKGGEDDMHTLSIAAFAVLAALGFTALGFVAGVAVAWRALG